jgi:hypothetical protein
MNDISGGGGSETTNSITVCVKANQISGVAASQAHVELYYDTFNPLTDTLPELLKIKADTNGRYLFDHITSGKYNVYSFYDSADAYRRYVFISTLKVPSDTLVKEFYSKPSSLQVIISKDTVIPLPTSMSSVQFYLKGSPFFIERDVRVIDSIAIPEIPKGTYSCGLSYSGIVDNTITYQLPDSVAVSDSTDSGNESQVLIQAKKADLQ